MANGYPFFSIQLASDWERARLDHVQLHDTGWTIRNEFRYQAIHRQDVYDWGVQQPIVHFATSLDLRIWMLFEDGSIWVNDRLQYMPIRWLHDHFRIEDPLNSRIAIGKSLLIIVNERTANLEAYDLWNGQLRWKQSFEERVWHFAIEANDHVHIMGLSDVQGQVNISSFNSYGEKIATMQLPQPDFANQQRADHGYFDMEKQCFAFWQAKGREFHLATPRDQNWEWHTIITEQELRSKESCYAFDLNRWLVLDRQQVNLYHSNQWQIPQWSTTNEQIEMLLMSKKQNDLFILTNNGKTIYQLSLTIGVAPHPVTNREEGWMTFPAFDCGVEGTVWHRLTIEHQNNQDGHFYVYAFASDQKTIASQGQWIDFDAYIQDPSHSQRKLNEISKPLWKSVTVNQSDVLFDRIQGRYLWLQIHLVGSVKATPALRKMRIYAPRQAYLDLLPGIYQEDANSALFLERFLSVGQSLLEKIDEKIRLSPRLFDVRLAPIEQLPELGRWLGWHFDSLWDEEMMRRWLYAAPELSAWRGTRYALLKMIELITGQPAYIMEHFQYKHLLDHPEYQDLIRKLYGDHPYGFIVFVQPEFVRNERIRALVEQIIQTEKPAHTEGRLILLHPWMTLGANCYIGLNSYLSEPSPLQMSEQSALPFHTVLVDVNLDHRLDTHTRIGIDTQLQ